MSGKITEAEWIWADGEFVPWFDANIHIMSLAVQFGSSIFEGIRCYDTPDGPAIFRLDAHLRRLEDSCKIYRTPLAYDRQQLTEASAAVIAKNDLSDCYLRPMVVRGYGAPGMLPDASPVHVYMVAFPWGTYLGEEALANGVDVSVSSWNRAAPNTFPSIAKSAGHYNNAQLIKMDAHANGYAEAIALGPGGLISEGSGQNLFLVRDNVVYTPEVDGTSLHGITRSSVITIAQDLGFEVREGSIARESLYTADELFFTGTASEVTPIRSVDRIEIGSGRRGPVTEKIQSQYLGVANGSLPDPHQWRTVVNQGAAAV